MTRLNANFTENMIDLLELSFIKRFITAFKVAGRENHPFIEPELIKVVGDVMMISG